MEKRKIEAARQELNSAMERVNEVLNTPAADFAVELTAGYCRAGQKGYRRRREAQRHGSSPPHSATGRSDRSRLSASPMDITPTTLLPLALAGYVLGCAMGLLFLRHERLANLCSFGCGTLARCAARSRA